MTDHSDKQEIEWQYDALDLRPVARWLESAARGRTPDGFEVEPLGEKKLSDTYLDTENWRVFRAGYALRIRRKGERGEKVEATMKLLSSTPSGDGPKVRREISEPLDSEDPAALIASKGPVGSRLRSLVGEGKPVALFEVETRRTAYRVSPETTVRNEGPESGNAPSAEIALDETGIPVPDGEPVSLKRVEVEVEEGDQGDFSSFVKNLAERFRLTPASTSKFEAGMFGLELTPPEPPDFGPKEVSADLTTGEFAYAVLRRQFEAFLSHEPGTRIGDDPEELHDMRVASRRMRAAMKVFRGALPVRSARFGDELKWVASFLGDVRDLDVQLEQLEVWSSDASPEDRDSLGELRLVLERGRETARRTMLRSFDSRRYSRFTESYPAFLLCGPSRRSVGARVPVLRSGPATIRKAYRKFRKLGDGITKSSPDAGYHELRKRGKRLRYTIEFLTPVYGTPAKEMITTLKSIQDVLGDHQDAVVAAGRLRELAPQKKKPGGLAPRVSFLMGGIAARYEAMTQELRQGFPEAYYGVRGKPWKRLRKAMEKEMEEAAEGPGADRS